MAIFGSLLYYFAKTFAYILLPKLIKLIALKFVQSICETLLLCKSTLTVPCQSSGICPDLQYKLHNKTERVQNARHTIFHYLGITPSALAALLHFVFLIARSTFFIMISPSAS